MDEPDSFEILALSIFQPSDDLFASFDNGFCDISTFNMSDVNGIPVDSERWGPDTSGYCVIA